MSQNLIRILLAILGKIFVLLKVRMVKERLEELSETRVQVLQVFQTGRNRQHVDRQTDRQKDKQTDTLTDRQQVLLQVYQTIGPDGKVRNKVRRVFKEVDTSNNDVVHNEDKSQMVKFCNRDVTKGAQKTLETLVELEEIEELSEPAEVFESSTEGGQVQVLQVFRTLGPDGVVRNRVRRVFKEEGTNNKKKNNNNNKNQVRQVCKEEEDINNEANIEKSQVVRFCQIGEDEEGVEEEVHVFKGDGIEFLYQLRMQVWETRHGLLNMSNVDQFRRRRKCRLENE